MLLIPQAQAIKQYHTIEELEQAVNKLAKSKEKTAKELKTIKQELEMTETHAKTSQGKTEGTLSQVMSELSTTKEALTESKKREKQVSKVTKPCIPQKQHRVLYSHEVVLARFASRSL